MAHVLHPGNEVADFARPNTFRGNRIRADDAQFQQFVGGAGRHHVDSLSGIERSVHDAHVGHDPAIRVINRVKNECAGRGVRLAGGRRDLGDDFVQQGLHAFPGLARNSQAVLGLAPDEVRQFFSVLFRHRAGQVDFVQHRNNGQVPLQGEVEVRQGLRLDALGGVHQQHRSFTSRQGTRDFIGKVHVTRGVNHVQGVGLVAYLPGHSHGLGFNGDAAFAFNVHPVQVLGTHLTVRDDPG